MPARTRLVILPEDLHERDDTLAVVPGSLDVVPQARDIPLHRALPEIRVVLFNSEHVVDIEDGTGTAGTYQRYGLVLPHPHAQLEQHIRVVLCEVGQD